MNTIAGEALRNSLTIAPTINADQGTRIMIFVRKPREIGLPGGMRIS